MKRLSVIVFLWMIFATSSVWSQSRNNIFLYIDNQPVEEEEFLYLYNKTHDVITEDKKKDLDNYLDLFIDYKLKIAEAKKLGLDKKSGYVEEVLAYRKELALNYLEESELSKAILKDLYHRSRKEIQASHILISLPAYSYGKDTIKAYKKISLLRERVLSGENFNQLALEHSDEPGVKDSKGNLGYFGSMQMVMSFEDAAYTTQIGEVSPIIRTNFGYHILKVHGQRPTENKLRTAHIMIMLSKDSLVDAKRIHEAYQLLKEGKSFANVAKIYSQDEATKNNGGELEPFGRKDIWLQVFTDTAYRLQEGEYSMPFKSNIGWHIIKLIERLPHPTKEEQIEEIIKFLKSSRGEEYYNQRKYKDLLSILAYDLHATAYLEDLIKYIDRKYLMSKTEPITLSNDKNNILFTLGEQTYDYNDFLHYLSNRMQRATRGVRTQEILENAFENYRNEKALDYYANKLFKENKEFAALINEYSNGVLLFELMQSEVWTKAANDTLAQVEYYNNNKREFELPERWEVTVYSTSDEIKATTIHEKLKSNVEEGEIGKVIDVKPTKEIWSKDLVEDKIAKLNAGQTVVLTQKGETYQIVKLYKQMPHEEIDFTSIRNEVVQAYMEAFEAQWLNNLRKKYKVRLNRKKWKKLKTNLL